MPFIAFIMYTTHRNMARLAAGKTRRGELGTRVPRGQFSEPSSWLLYCFRNGGNFGRVKRVTGLGVNIGCGVLIVNFIVSHFLLFYRVTKFLGKIQTAR